MWKETNKRIFCQLIANQMDRELGGVKSLRKQFGGWSMSMRYKQLENEQRTLSPKVWWQGKCIRAALSTDQVGNRYRNYLDEANTEIINKTGQKSVVQNQLISIIYLRFGVSVEEFRALIKDCVHFQILCDPAKVSNGTRNNKPKEETGRIRVLLWSRGMCRITAYREMVKFGKSSIADHRPLTVITAQRDLV